MDPLLEALKHTYKDMNEEENILREIEDMINQPDNIEEPEVTKQEPVLPAITSKTKLAPSVKVPTEPVDKNLVLPPVSTKMAVPSPKEIPIEPASSEVDVPPIPSTDIDANDAIPPGLYAKVMNKLIKLGRERKAYSMRIVGSEALSKLIYSPTSKTLTVKFLKNKRTYRYRNVGMAKAAAMITSNHKGSLLNRSIKDEKPYKEI